MTTKTLAAGWVVHLTIPGKRTERPDLPWVGAVLSSPTFHFFNVAIGDADKAIEAARRKAGAPADALMRVVRALSPSEIAAHNLRAGEARSS
jgi:hypothetical protein